MLLPNFAEIGKLWTLSKSLESDLSDTGIEQLDFLRFRAFVDADIEESSGGRPPDGADEVPDTVSERRFRDFFFLFTTWKSANSIAASGVMRRASLFCS